MRPLSNEEHNRFASRLRELTARQQQMRYANQAQSMDELSPIFTSEDFEVVTDEIKKVLEERRSASGVTGHTIFKGELI